MIVEETRLVDDSKITERELTFYYSREQRLAKAPQQVRDLYDPAQTKRPTFFSSLTDSKPKKLSFISIVALSVTILVLTYINPASNALLLGNKVDISAMHYQDDVFVVLKKTVKKKNAYTGIIDITTASVYNDINKTSAKIVWTDLPKEEFRFRLPFQAEKISIRLQALDKTLTILATPE
jgi:hypothetical protein